MKQIPITEEENKAYAIVTNYLQKPENKVVFDYPKFGGMWSCDEYRVDNVIYRLYEGNSEILLLNSFDKVDLQLSVGYLYDIGTTITYYAGNREDFLTLARFITVNSQLK